MRRLVFVLSLLLALLLPASVLAASAPSVTLSLVRTDIASEQVTVVTHGTIPKGVSWTYGYVAVGRGSRYLQVLTTNTPTRINGHRVSYRFYVQDYSVNSHGTHILLSSREVTASVYHLASQRTICDSAQTICVRTSNILSVHGFSVIFSGVGLRTYSAAGGVRFSNGKIYRAPNRSFTFFGRCTNGCGT